MKESFWVLFIIVAGIVIFYLMNLFQDVTVNQDHNYYLLKEITAGAMMESVDILEYRDTGELVMDESVFKQAFFRRYAESTLDTSSTINFYDINLQPPKVSVEMVSPVGYSIPFVGTGMLSTRTRVDQIIESKD